MQKFYLTNQKYYINKVSINFQEFQSTVFQIIHLLAPKTENLCLRTFINKQFSLNMSPENSYSFNLETA